MTNLILHYFQRDEGNWKIRLSICIQNPAGYTSEEAEEMIRQRLIDREFFYPDRVGLEYAVSRFDQHELDCVENDSEGVEKPIAMTFETLLEKLEASTNLHPKASALPAVPVRMKDSLLEFMRDLRQTVSFLKFVRKDSVVLVFRNAQDWHLIEETLRLDAESGGFDSDIRRDITRALNGTKEITNIPALRLLRAKLMRFETRLAKQAK